MRHPSGCQSGLAGSKVALEIVGAQLIDGLVAVTVRRDLVPSLRDFTDQAWLACGDPAEHKKRPAGATTIQQIQQVARRLDDTARQLIPVHQG